MNTLTDLLLYPYHTGSGKHDKIKDITKVWTGTEVSIYGSWSDGNSNGVVNLSYPMENISLMYHFIYRINIPDMVLGDTPRNDTKLKDKSGNYTDWVKDVVNKTGLTYDRVANWWPWDMVYGQNNYKYVSGSYYKSIESVNFEYFHFDSADISTRGLDVADPANNVTTFKNKMFGE